MDEAEKMADLVLNTDFDASLLDCWDANASKTGTKDSHQRAASQSPQSNMSVGGRAGFDASSGPGLLSQLPAFSATATMANDNLKEDCIDSSNRKICVSTLRNKPFSAATTRVQGEPWQPERVAMSVNSLHSLPSPKVAAVNSALISSRKETPKPVSTATSVTSPSTRSSARNATKDGQQDGAAREPTQTEATGKLDAPVEISASYPKSNQSPSPLHTLDGSNTTQMHPLAIPSSANCPPHVVTGAQQAAPLQTVAGIQSAPFPVTLTTLGGPATSYATTGLALSAPQVSTTATQNNGASQQLAKQQTQNQQREVRVAPLLFPAQPFNGLPGDLQRSSYDTLHLHFQHREGEQPRREGDSRSSDDATSQSTPPPPFYLFDAPVELRVNFMQSQRLHGLPLAEDSNAYHYGVAVNGFHPQLNASVNHSTMLNASGGESRSNGGRQNHHFSSPVQLVDARHSNRKAGRIKNEREQRRAQKITELIDQLREKMERGGWKVEVKSKFHTLSSCADYVKHLIKVTKEKEDAVNKARSDLQIKKRKVEEEKALQESRSDPESVMSSLTSSTGDSGNFRSAGIQHNAKVSSEASSSKASSETSSSKARERKRKFTSTSVPRCKSRKIENGDSGLWDSLCDDPQHTEKQLTEKTASSFSDLTDNNKRSEPGKETGHPGQRCNDDGSQTASSICASSSAAVVQGRDGGRRHTKHADVVIKERNRERQHKFLLEATSLEESFVLDYEEVFVKSNVPQIIATTAGRIVAWNEFFLKATGISKGSVNGLTIFSLVRQEKLSNLFEIVAKALRRGASSASADSDSRDVAGASICVRDRTGSDFATMTLPCVDFPSSRARAKSGSVLVNPLFITVTLMTDDDPRKRLFHCVFTDCPGTCEALGAITPELLSTLFARHR